jgi:hypothetical protein
MEPWLAKSYDDQAFLKEVVAELGTIVYEVVQDMYKGTK